MKHRTLATVIKVEFAKNESSFIYARLLLTVMDEVTNSTISLSIHVIDEAVF
jgi:hypothetical protein